MDLSDESIMSLVLHWRGDDCRSNQAPRHARKQEVHPPRVKKKEQKKEQKRKEKSSVSIQMILVLSWRKQHGHLQNKRLI